MVQSTVVDWLEAEFAAMDDDEMWTDPWHNSERHQRNTFDWMFPGYSTNLYSILSFSMGFKAWITTVTTLRDPLTGSEILCDQKLVYPGSELPTFRYHSFLIKSPNQGQRKPRRFVTYIHWTPDLAMIRTLSVLCILQWCRFHTTQRWSLTRCLPSEPRQFHERILTSYLWYDGNGFPRSNWCTMIVKVTLWFTKKVAASFTLVELGEPYLPESLLESLMKL